MSSGWLVKVRVACRNRRTVEDANSKCPKAANERMDAQMRDEYSKLMIEMARQG